MVYAIIWMMFCDSLFHRMNRSVLRGSLCERIFRCGSTPRSAKPTIPPFRGQPAVRKVRDLAEAKAPLSKGSCRAACGVTEGIVPRVKLTFKSREQATLPPEATPTARINRRLMPTSVFPLLKESFRTVQPPQSADAASSPFQGQPAVRTA